MTIDSTNYLDIGNLFFNELIGDYVLGVIIGILVVFMIGSKLKFHSPVMLAFCALWIAAVFTYNYSFIMFWVFVVLFAGTSFYYTFSKLFSR